MRLLFFLIFFWNVTTLFAQVPNKWSVLFGTEEFTGLSKKDTPEDIPYKIIESSDGGYFITGTNNHDSGDPKPNTMGSWLAKFSAEGKLLWWKNTGSTFNHFKLITICATPDGGILVTDDTGGNTYGLGEDDLIIIKYDKDGNIVFNNTIKSGTICDNGLCAEKTFSPQLLFLTKKGTIKMIIYSALNTSGSSQDTLSLLTFDSEGRLLTTKFINAKMNGAGNSIAYTINNDIYISGILNDRLVLYKFSSEGMLSWSYEADLPGKDFATVITCTKDGNALVKAYRYDDSPNNVLFVSVDAEGKEIFRKKLSLQKSLKEIIETGKNQYITAHEDFQSPGKFIFTAIDSDGKTIWKKSFGNKNSGIKNFVITKDGGFVILAITNDFGSSYLDAWIIKTDNLGNTVPVPVHYTKRK